MSTPKCIACEVERRLTVIAPAPDEYVMNSLVVLRDAANYITAAAATNARLTVKSVR
jgi:hypothetical protein